MPNAATTDATANDDPSSTHGRLLQLLGAPIASDSDANTRFARLAQILTDACDRRAPFATLYAMTTTNIIAAIASGQFQDADWVRKYLNEFAERYREAFYNDESGNRAAVSASWAIAFDAAASRKELVIQDLALGVNAHVDGDLAFALQTVGIGTANEIALRASRYADHMTVNGVLHAELQATVARTAELYAPGLGMLPSDLAPALENAFFALLVEGREKAWDHAVALVDGIWLAKESTKGEILALSTSVARGILAPELSPELMAPLRELEATGTLGVRTP